jgi:hypothetical protein
VLLDHPSLEPFEPLVRDLFDLAFGAALRGLAAAGLQPEEVWHTEAGRMFQAACLPGFKRAQEAVGTKVIAFEKQIASLRADEATARVKRDITTAGRLKELRVVLQNRQLVQRRLLDAMLWVLVWPNRWVIRQLRLEGGIKRIDPSVVEPWLRAVSQEHSKSDETFLLLCDLTTVAQLGDLIIAKWNPNRNSMRIVVGEGKVGPRNVLLYKRLHDPAVPDQANAISKISQELGAKAAKQAQRMVKQEARLRNFGQVVATDEGTHPMTGQPFSLGGGAHAAKDCRDEIRTLIARAKLEGSYGLTLDGCLHFYAFTADNKPPSKEALATAHAFYNMKHGDLCGLKGPHTAQEEEITAIRDGPRVINLFDFGMHNSIGMPPLLWYPRDAMLDVLMGRVKVFAQLEHEKFFEFASRAGLRMRFITGREAGQIKSAKLFVPLPEYRDVRFVRAENAQGTTTVFGARFFARVYLDLIRPNDLLFMAQDLVRQATEDRQHKRRDAEQR